MAVKDNAVRPVLFYSVLTGAIIWLPLLVASHFKWLPEEMRWLQVDATGGIDHLLLAIKSAIVGASWGFAYAALKHLPITIASTIRATSPLWTILIATLFLDERPSLLQWSGVALILSSFYAFSLVGKREGIHFRRNKWVACMMAATILAACSALYDKYLLQRMDYSPATVQAWFSVYLVLVTLPFYVHWVRAERRKRTDPFQWRSVIPWIGILLLITDFLYFTALEQPDAMISLVSPLRRTSVLVTFLYGIRMLKEKSYKPKAVCLAGMLAGVFLLSLA
ncbi:MAG: DMT family transporter [Planctomycetales bacterium]|nr:DMT family transporter [Planctomycetales bacterium]